MKKRTMPMNTMIGLADVEQCSKLVPEVAAGEHARDQTRSLEYRLPFSDDQAWSNWGAPNLGESG